MTTPASSSGKTSGSSPDDAGSNPAAGAILDAHGESMETDAVAWTRRVRDLYAAEGLEPVFTVTEDGQAVRAIFNDVETTHDVGEAELEAHVPITAAAMKRGPLYGNGVNRR